MKVNLNGPCDMSGIYIANSTFRAAFFPGGAVFQNAYAVGSDFSKARRGLAEIERSPRCMAAHPKIAEIWSGLEVAERERAETGQRRTGALPGNVLWGPTR